jgi:NADH-quinone oxidoreductase subunit L
MLLSSTVLLVIALAPLAGALLAGLFGTAFLGNVLSRTMAHRITILGVAISFALSVWVLQQVLDGASFHATIYQWMVIGDLKLEIGFLVDSLTAMMMCVVTFVSLMVHIYTIGYMQDDLGYNRFFAYISLFTFSMLMLVMSNNFLQLFFGWEAVGLVSYLLIGFWYTRSTAVFANMKAFLVNRVGDFGFILGIGLLLAYGGSMNYAEIFAQRDTLVTLTLPGTEWNLITVACICLFIGAMGKSAQFPLHVWLPDSMEGPTPISALIHAATMVTAGIFMVSRMSPLFELSDTALSFMLIIGAITALFMGILGIIQNDIKRVVAYSTLSQLGYMTVALGASAYSVALFHLMTHAFFKALLFLGAGSVIIGMHHDQDIRSMGGVWKYMPITWITSLLGSLALIGTPLFSGFYSKDSIIEAVKASSLPGADFAYCAVLVGVFITAFYSFRMFFLVFHGQERFGQSVHQHDDAHHHGLMPGQKPHESSWVITLPLILLAIPSVIIGAWAIEPMLFGDFFKQGVAAAQVIIVADTHLAMVELSQAFHGWGAMAVHAFTTLPFWFALLGVFCAWIFYLVRPTIPVRIYEFFQRTMPWVLSLLNQKYYMDKINETVFAAGARRLGTSLWHTGDERCIDGLVNGSANLIGRFSQLARKLQSGYLYHYAFAMILGILGLIAWVLLSNIYYTTV